MNSEEIKNITQDLLVLANCMEKIMQRFDNLERMLVSHIGVDKETIKCLGSGRILDNQDLCDILNTSKRTIQRFRSEKKLPYHRVGGKTYYKESDVMDFIKRYMTVPE